MRFLTTVFVKAELPRDLRSLVAFDRKVFPTDRFSAAEWRQYESYWLTLDGRRIGCCAFERNPDHVYIATTGILPAFQGMGFGRLLKAWEIAWARRNGFHRIVAHTRKGNKAMIALNRTFGFRVTATIRNYYDDPPDSAVVMELDARTS